MNDFTSDESEHDQPAKSKTALKKEMQELQKLGTALVELSDKQLAQIPLDPDLGQAIDLARNLKQREARRRQLQYIGKLMRSADIEAINNAYQKLLAKNKHHVQHEHQTERWRQRLLEEGNSTLNEFIQQFPEADIQHLRQLIRGAKKEQSQNKPPAQARKLFRYIRQLLD